jgi:phage I-like protein
MSRKTIPSAAALTFEIAPLADGAQLLIPDGLFRSTDGSGRPEGVPGWRLDATLAARIIAARQARGIDIVIDYEHSTVLRAKKGEKAPAAGWAKPATLEYRPGVGLVARAPDWTPVARAHLDAREYRYGSPVILYDPKTGDVTGLHSFALTNDPGLSGINTALSAPDFLIQETPEVNPLLAALIASLGLPAGTTDDAVITAVTALKAKADKSDAEVAVLRATPPDPSKYVPMSMLADARTELATKTAELAAVQTKAREAEVDALIASVPDKITPAMAPNFRLVGLQSLESLTAIIATLPAVPGIQGGTQTNGKAPEGGQAVLSADEQAVCKAMGIAEADFLKTKEGK